MKQILLMIAVVALVGCGKKEPELRSEKVITPNEAANKLFVEGIELFNQGRFARGDELTIKIWKQALAKFHIITSEYKESDIAVKLVSGEKVITGWSLGEFQVEFSAINAAAEAKAAAEAETKAAAEAIATKAVAEAIAAKAAAEAKEQSTIVEIADPIIEKAIREELKRPTHELTKADLEKVTKFSGKLYYRQLTDVKALEKLTNLASLNLGGNQLTSVKGLEKLTKLTQLSLSANQLTDVKGLGKLNQLRRLNLYNNPALTKAQIDQLQKELPKCDISSNPTK